MAEFAAICPTTVLSGISSHKSLARRAMKKMRLDGLGVALGGRATRRHHDAAAELVYCNSIAASDVLACLLPVAKRTVLHVHELEFTIRTLGGDAAPLVLSQVGRIIACSHAVSENLIARHNVPGQKIDVVHEFIPTRDALRPPSNLDRLELRRRLSLPPDASVVGACGQPDWRKGTDIFVQLAASAVRKRAGRPPHFIWIGGASDSDGALQLRHDLDLAGIGSAVTHIPNQADPAPLFRGLDLFVLPSREDPYPLVCLEAAACSIPIVCFDRAGGIPEFVENDCGVVVPYLRVDEMVATICSLLDDPPRLAQLGATARRKVVERHDVAIAAPKVLAAMVRAAAAPAISSVESTSN